jgi:hypothetical protein
VRCAPTVLPDYQTDCRDAISTTMTSELKCAGKSHKASGLGFERTLQFKVARLTSTYEIFYEC